MSGKRVEEPRLVDNHWRNYMEKTVFATRWAHRSCLSEIAFTFKDLPDVESIVTRRNWKKFLSTPPPEKINRDWVREFCTALSCSSRLQEGGVTKVQVRGKEVVFTPEIINTFYGLPPTGGLTHTDLRKLVKEYPADMAEMRQHFCSDWFWLKIINNRIYPLSNFSEFSVHILVLVLKIWSNEDINIGDLIFWEMQMIPFSDINAPCILPTLINFFCKEGQVPAWEHDDMELHCL